MQNKQNSERNKKPIADFSSRNRVAQPKYNIHESALIYTDIAKYRMKKKTLRHKTNNNFPVPNNTVIFVSFSFGQS